MIRLASVLLLLALGTPSIGRAQSSAVDQSVQAIVAPDSLQDTTYRPSASAAAIPHKQRKVAQPIGELRPELVWQWGPILATVLAMAGAIVLTLPVALAYRWTKPERDYDPGVMHSAIILAPTIAGLLIVIQGSLAMAFSLAGVATAVRFRNSLKDTNDAVYVFVAVAIGLAAGVQALDIALAISLSFSAMVVLLSRSPFRYSSPPHHSGHGHRQQQHHDGAESPVPAEELPARTQLITVRTGDTTVARPAVESVLDREAKRWRLERVAAAADGATTLTYAVRCRKRVPYSQLLVDLRAAAGSQGFMVEAGAAPGATPASAA